MNRKIQTYLGFAIKAGRATLGLDRIEELRRPPRLLIVDKTLSANSAGKAKRIAEALGCPLVTIEEKVEDLTHRVGCKAVAVSHRELAEAILKEMAIDASFGRIEQFGGKQ